jgi:hypothetical protein
VKFPLFARVSTMTRCAGALALVVAFVIGAGTAAAAAPANKPRPKPVVFANEQVPSALLAVEDFPAGWAGVQKSAGAPEGACNGPNALARAQSAGVVGMGEANFAKDPTNGPFVSASLYSFPSVAAAKTFMRTSAVQVKACTTQWQTPNPQQPRPGDTWTWTVSAMSFPRVGDQVVAWREVATAECSPPLCSMSVSSPPKPVDEVYVRKGNNVLRVVRAQLYTTGDNLSGDIQSDVHSALDQLENALRRAKPRLGA